MCKVMVVDDDENLRELVMLFLKRQGYEVLAATNGIECLKHAREGFNGIILMDVSMPVMDGWRTVESLRREQLLHRSLVCMLTGLEPAGEGAGLEDCIFDYLLKPFTRDKLVSMVSTAESCLAA
jgi:two-component system OmpR family response regulator